MRIGTTPTHTFTLPASIASTVAKVRVVYSQCDKVVLTKDVTRLTGNDVIVKLKQEETLKFHDRKPIKIQLRVLTTTSESLTSDIITRSPCECLEKAVLS